MFTINKVWKKTKEILQKSRMYTLFMILDLFSTSFSSLRLLWLFGFFIYRISFFFICFSWLLYSFGHFFQNFGQIAESQKQNMICWTMKNGGKRRKHTTGCIIDRLGFEPATFNSHAVYFDLWPLKRKSVLKHWLRFHTNTLGCFLGQKQPSRSNTAASLSLYDLSILLCLSLIFSIFIFPSSLTLSPYFCPYIPMLSLSLSLCLCIPWLLATLRAMATGHQRQSSWQRCCLGAYTEHPTNSGCRRALEQRNLMLRPHVFYLYTGRRKYSGPLLQ